MGGWGHNTNCTIQYPEYAVFDPAVVQAAIACVLLDHGRKRAKKIVEDYKPIISSIAEYCAAMDKMCKSKRPIVYDENGAYRIVQR